MGSADEIKHCFFFMQTEPSFLHGTGHDAGHDAGYGAGHGMALGVGHGTGLGDMHEPRYGAGAIHCYKRGDKGLRMGRKWGLEIEGIMLGVSLGMGWM